MRSRFSMLIALVAGDCRPAVRAPAVTVHVTSTAAASVCDTVALGWRATGQAEVRLTADTVMGVRSDSATQRGCAVYASATKGVDTTTAKLLYWRDETRPGWTDLSEYDAEGPDGNSRIYERPGLRCQVEFSQDGGDDSDSTYVASPAISETTFCWGVGA